MISKTITLLKTIFFNFHYFPLKTAIKLPVIIDKNVLFRELKGEVIIKPEIRKGMISIGKKNVGIFDERFSKTILEIRGTIIFGDNVFLGHGSRICVNENAKLEFGSNSRFGAEVTVVCYKNIQFGADCFISWENLFMDTDFHSIYDENGIKINSDADIIIGNKSWIGCRCTVLKGTKIFNETIVAPNSLLSREYKGGNQILGGIPALALKKNVRWEP